MSMINHHAGNNHSGLPHDGGSLDLRERVAAVLADAGKDGDAVIHLGNWHDAYPRLLCYDPFLDAVDIRIWLIIRSRSEPASARPFPGYEEIRELAQLGSRATVAKSLKILRATRWLSLCATRREETGQVMGNIYALHDKPIAVGEAIALDPKYMSLLENMAADRRHGQVRRVGMSVLGSIDKEITAGDDPTASRLLDGPLAQAMAYRTVEQIRRGEPPDGAFLHSRFDGAGGQKNESIPVSATLNHAPSRVHLMNSAKEPGESSRCQSSSNELSHRVHLMNSCSSSSKKSNFKKKATTTALVEDSEAELGPESPDLVYPDELTDNEKQIAARQIRSIEPEHRQPVLDELGEQIKQRRNSSNRIRRPNGLLRKLCSLISEGELPFTSAAAKRQADRARLAQEQEKIDRLTEEAKERLSHLENAFPLEKKIMRMAGRSRSEHLGSIS